MIKYTQNHGTKEPFGVAADGGRKMDIEFYIMSLLFGVALAMDAFSVSLANGLNEPRMRVRRMCAIAGTFAFFQAFMPMAGWVCVKTVLSFFGVFEKVVPWIALVLLCFIGGKMIFESRGETNEATGSLGFGALLLQGVATSIDALSVGLDTVKYGPLEALASSLIISVVTFIICMAGLFIGKKAGTRLAGKASILGGIILIAIGVEIFLSGILK